MSSFNPIGSPFIELHTVDSTNNYAMGLVHAGMAQHGLAVFAHDQTKGRGQRQKQWVSKAGNNIAVSIIIEPHGLATSQIFLLSKSIAIGALHFLNSYTAGEVRIKWPNDLYWRDRKAGGILIENILLGDQWKFAVAGIGININQTDFEAFSHKAVSLKQITGKIFEPALLARELCQYLEASYKKLNTDPHAVSRDYQAHLFKRDEPVKLKKGTQVFEAVVREVSDLGQLVVEHGGEERFDVGEVEWLV